ncbi:hypothetical protein [Alkalimonas sp.]|uniref:hypothetical protein n=1 Tax=Alkalimonas sp. TaxID=1872453 RepID=UPI00263AF9DE|nr:hypothetical protein [Alkalimonas sp.]MCC5824700.1 hypothetical protein [Alkalimonas sp.]
MFKLRCYAKKDGDVFVAVCIDLCLAAQGESLQDAIEKLDSQIAFYVTDVYENERDHAEQLLTRKAPWQQRLTYYAIKFMSNIHIARDRFKDYWRSSLPYVRSEQSHSH